MRHLATAVLLTAAACTSGPVRAPNDAIFYEVPPAAPQPVAPLTSGRDDFTGRIEAVLAEGDAAPVPLAAAPTPPVAGLPAPVVPVGATPTPLDDDRLNLNLYTLEQQRIDAAIAERELAEARSQLVIVEPGAVPQTVQGVNIALYANQTTNRVGERRYQRSFAFGGGNCSRFGSADQAQRVFLSAGGPQRDPYNLDPDGDGFACNWDPEPFRRLRL